VGYRHRIKPANTFAQNNCSGAVWTAIPADRHWRQNGGSVSVLPNFPRHSVWCLGRRASGATSGRFVWLVHLRPPLAVARGAHRCGTRPRRQLQHVGCPGTYGWTCSQARAAEPGFTRTRAFSCPKTTNPRKRHGRGCRGH